MMHELDSWGQQNKHQILPRIETTLLPRIETIQRHLGKTVLYCLYLFTYATHPCHLSNPALYNNAAATWP